MATKPTTGAFIRVRGASEHNLKHIDVDIPRQAITIVTGVSGSGKSSLVFDTIQAEAQRRFFSTLSYYTRQFLGTPTKPEVLSVTGLSPAIALAQNETQPSSRASVGTFSDVAELIGVLLARYGAKTCPDHGHGTTVLSFEEQWEYVNQHFQGQVVAVTAPIAEQRKGSFRNKLQSFKEHGFLKVWIDGALHPTSPVRALNKEERHTIKLVLDMVKVAPHNMNRLKRGLERALELGEGYAEVFLASKTEGLDITHCLSVSTKGGCPTCGYSWPALDPRYFSANSLGRCTLCHGSGVPTAGGLTTRIQKEPSDDEGLSSDHEPAKGQLYCSHCQGVGIDPHYNAISWEGWHVYEFHKKPLKDLQAFFVDVVAHKLKPHQLGPKKVCEEILGNLRRIDSMGISYLSMMRRLNSLSGGELQRLKLSHVLSEHMRGVLYILDEPSQGLHPYELSQLCQGLRRLTEAGNTVLIVDHDDILMKQADYIIDMGPVGGTEGGYVMAQFHPAEAHAHVACSQTARLLHQGFAAVPRADTWTSTWTATGWLIVREPRLNYLSMASVSFPLGGLTVVTGVSGSGKSSLVLGCLFENLQRALLHDRPGRIAWQHVQGIEGYKALDQVYVITRKPLAKNSASIPATYLDIWADLRALFAQLPSAQIAGLGLKHFSLNTSGGRCETCKGRGAELLSMRFLPDARVLCHECQGQRYKDHILTVTYKGCSMLDILHMTLAEVAEFFKSFPKILRKLQPALDLGLGYLKLGQPSGSLSGGEAQRLKLVPFLSKGCERALFILDEPTQGLHSVDTSRLIQCLHTLVRQGGTVVVIEHHTEVIRHSHWVVDLGPGASDQGGQLLYQGPVLPLKQVAASLTAQYM